MISFRTFIIANLLLALILQLVMPSNTYAASASEWKAGNIISDEVFTNRSAMSVDDIQRFLNSKVTCDTWGVKRSELGGGTRAQYGASVGNPAPFTCLRDYHEVPKSSPGAYIPANNYGNRPIPPGARSAAQIIWDAAQQYNINPQVILVKIATESAGPLTSDEWPLLKQYTYAMGAHCPDSGPGGSANCDINYAGFSIQVSEGAALMRSYLNNMSQPWWSYRKPFAVNSILWNVVERGCGAGNVYIESKATAALYTYTPYQPNQAALNNMYGTGDNCSAYGNRNFWRVFVDWFGSSQNSSPFFSHSGRVFMRGSGNTYYSVPSQEILNAYGVSYAFGNKINYVDASYTIGMTNKGDLPWIARFDNSNNIYIVTEQGLHRFTEENFYRYGYSFGQEALLSSTVAGFYPQGTEVSSVASQTDWRTIHLIEDGHKREIADGFTFENTGSPSYSSRPHTTLPPAYLNTLPTGKPVIADGRFVKDPSTGQLNVTAGGALQAILPGVGNNSGITPDYSPDSNNFSRIPISQNPWITTQHVRSSSNENFILDASFKYKVQVSDTSKLISPTPQIVSDAFLNRFTARTFPRLVRNVATPQVYQFGQDGKIYHVYTEKTLTRLGFTQLDVSVIKSPMSDLFINSNLPIFATGTLARELNSPSVFLITGQRSKAHIASETVLYGLGYGYNDVDVVSTGTLNSYPASAQPLTQLVSTPAGKWYAGSSCKWKFTASELMNLSIDDSFFTALDSDNTLKARQSCGDVGNVIRADGQPTVYMVENNKKRWITSETVFYRLGLKWENVRILPQSLIDKIPSGSTLN